MTQTQFALRRNELIAKYLRSIRPLWEKYQSELTQAHNDRYARKAYEKFRHDIKSHLELLFARIAQLKQQNE